MDNLDNTESWVKLAAAWLFTVAGYVTEHMTAGKIALIATIILTLLQCYRVWLDIRLRRRQLGDGE